MMLIPDLILRLTLWLLLAPLLPGIINKVKAWVAGRRGPPVLQLYYDLAQAVAQRRGDEQPRFTRFYYWTGGGVGGADRSRAVDAAWTCGGCAEFSRRCASADLPAGAGAVLHGLGRNGNRFGLRGHGLGA